MPQMLSIWLSNELATRLYRFARTPGNSVTRTRASVLLLDEALRDEDFAG